LAVSAIRLEGAVLHNPFTIHAGVLDPQGPIGAQQREILFNATAIMLAVIVPVIILTLVFAWWFRAGNSRARRSPDWSYSGALEVIVWSIPALVVLFLGGVGWIGAHDLDPPRAIKADAAPVDIGVVSLDWKWLFIYPAQGIASVNRLTIPAGTPIHFRLTSGSVMNSFFVPQLGSQIYTMGGMTTRLNLLADRPGTYPGLSAQFSGNGFSNMHFDVVALPADRFDAWVKETRGAGGTLDRDAYKELARPNSLAQPKTFGSIAPNLFESIVERTTMSPKMQSTSTTLVDAPPRLEK
jgi:cytochrome o ubiquinol oxidase subunit II